MNTLTENPFAPKTEYWLLLTLHSSLLTFSASPNYFELILVPG
jgi:hypothetical protein